MIDLYPWPTWPTWDFLNRPRPACRTVFRSPALLRFSGTYRTESPRLLCSMGMTEDLGGKIGMVGGMEQSDLGEGYSWRWGDGNLALFNREIQLQKVVHDPIWKRRLILSLSDNNYSLHYVGSLAPTNSPTCFPNAKQRNLFGNSRKRQLCGKKWWQSLASLVRTVLGIQSGSLARSFTTGCRVIYRYVWVLVSPCPLLGKPFRIQLLYWVVGGFLLSRKLTWNLKIYSLKRKFIFSTSIFGFQVGFKECM